MKKRLGTLPFSLATWCVVYKSNHSMEYEDFFFFKKNAIKFANKQIASSIITEVKLQNSKGSSEILKCNKKKDECIFCGGMENLQFYDIYYPGFYFHQECLRETICGDKYSKKLKVAIEITKSIKDWEEKKREQQKQLDKDLLECQEYLCGNIK